MNKKQNIQIAVIVVFFAAAAFILYKGGLFGGGQSAAPVAAAAAAAAQPILPNGSTFDFNSVILPSRFNYNAIEYPQLDAQNDVGVPVDNLISPLPSNQ
jgi:hypothetical protein